MVKIAYSIINYGRLKGTSLWHRPPPARLMHTGLVRLLKVQKRTQSQMACANGTADGSSCDDQRNSCQEQSLLFLFDLETTGLDVYTESITEIAGKVFNPPATVSNTSFSSLVYTRTYIPEIVRHITGITADMLKDEEPLSIILPKFFSWLSDTTQEVTESTGLPHHPVLVAHNGNNFDFPLLLAEIRRTPELCTSTLVQQNILFADTLPFLKKLQNSGDYFLKGESLGLQNLYKLCFPGKAKKGHRALADVEALEEILNYPGLADVPTALPQRPATTVIKSMTSSTK